MRFSCFFLLLCTTINLYAQAFPENGKFYSIRSYVRNSYLHQKADGGNYIYYDGRKCDGPNAVWEFVATTGYWGNRVYNIRNLHSGMFIGNKSAMLTDKEENALKFELVYEYAYDDAPYFRLDNASNLLSTYENNGIVTIGFEFDGNHGRYYIDEVSSFGHKLTVGASGWATLVLGFNSLIPTPDGLKAYVVGSIADDRLELEEVSGVLEANTPVIINAPEGMYEFVYTNEAPNVCAESSFLKGTLCDKDVVPSGNAYVLSLVDGKVGFYRAEKNRLDGYAFMNNSHKAYLDLPEKYQKNSMRLYFTGAVTSVDNVEVELVESAVYDMTGRKIERIVVPGMYIINGKKVLVND